MSWFRDLKISAKLVSAFIAVAIIAGIVGLVGIINIKVLEKNDRLLYENATLPIMELSDISTTFERVRIHSLDIILANTAKNIEEIEQKIIDSRVQINKAIKNIEGNIGRIDKEGVFDEYLRSREVYETYLNQIIVLARDNKDGDALVLYRSEDMRKVVQEEQEAIEKLISIMNEYAGKMSKQNKRTSNAAVIIMILFMLGGMALAGILGIYVSSIISKPVQQIVAQAEKIAEGDLDIEINVQSNDEIGELAKAFMKMSDYLNEVISNISNAAEQVASGSKQAASSSMALSQGATEQASSIEQLTASLEEISSQTKLNAQNADQASKLAGAAKNNAVQGNERMKGMVKAMEEINTSSTNISKIIKVIDEIAFQTNILALNAAVEAARAGQHGKGFAVVAEEVRNLAARSAQAARETTVLIENSIKKTGNGTQIAKETADALKNIVEEVEKTAALVESIATASNEQAIGISQINQGIMQVSDVVQTNSATSEETAAAGEELSGQAELLKEAVSKFNLKKIDQIIQKYEDIDPKIVKMIEEMLESKKSENDNIDEDDDDDDEKPEEETKDQLQIDLNDQEFGKY